jgi:DNA-binding NarL/FixJ family response regulator
VLACLKNGLSNKQIARELDMSEATVKVHVRHIMKKLGASNRTQAVVLALATATKRTTPEPVTSPPMQASAWKRAARVN